MKTKPNIVVLGGGTGTFTVLTGLKKYPLGISAIVAMVDDGGSTGILRDELGVLPPGDVRQCLVALSKSDRTMRELFAYRFEKGALRGHNFGNIFLSALEKTTGSFDMAVEKASDVLRLKGEVIPSTLDKITLIAKLANGKVIRGEDNIGKSNVLNSKSLEIIPGKARANPRALAAIKEADLIVFAPGDLYTSILPNILIKGIRGAVRKSAAKKVLVSNLMNKKGHTDNFTVHDFVSKLEGSLSAAFDFVIYNNKFPPKSLVRKYAMKGEYPVGTKIHSVSHRAKYIGGDFVSRKIFRGDKSDALRHTRSLIRHDSDKLAGLIYRKIIRGAS